MDAQYHGAVLPGLLVQQRAMTHPRTSAAVGVLNLMLPRRLLTSYGQRLCSLLPQCLSSDATFSAPFL